MYGASVVLFEGILTFHSKPLRDLMDLKIFVDTDSDIRLARRFGSYECCMISIDAHLFRLQRDIAERGRELDSVLKQYEKFVKPVRLVEW